MAEHDSTPGAGNPANSTHTTHSIMDPALDLKKRARRRLVGASALALLAIIVLPMVMDAEPRPNTAEIQIRIPSQEPGSNIVALPIEPRRPPPVRAQVQASHQPPAETHPKVAETGKVTKAATATAAASQNAVANASAAPGKAEAHHDKVAEKRTSKPAHDIAPSSTKTSEASKPAEKQPAKSAKETAQADQERARALALLNDDRWIIQLGAYKDQGNVRILQQKVKELGYPVITEHVDTAAGPRTRVRVGPFHNRADADQAHVRLKKIAAGGPTGGSIAQLK